MDLLSPIAEGMTVAQPNRRITAGDARVQLQQALAALPSRYLARPLEPGLAMRIVYALQDQFNFILLRLCMLFGCRNHRIRL